MAKSRTPTKKAAVSGASIKNPGRFKNRKGPAKPSPIGEPYAHMTPVQVEVWIECRRNMPWLNAAHRILLRQVCILTARMDTAKGLSVSATHALSSMLSKLGATPADESKVNHEWEPADPDEEFFAGPPNSRLN